MKQAVARLISNTEVTPGVHLLWLECPEIAAAVKPGQYVMVRSAEGMERLLRRPLTVHQVDRRRVAILFAVVGQGTGWLSRRKAGESLDWFGPLGNGYSIDPKARKLLLAAGGMGIAPLRFLAQEALRHGSSVTLLLGARTASCLYPINLVPMGIKMVAATDNGTAGRKGLVTDLIPEYIGWADQVVACGPLRMYRDMHTRREELLKGKPVQVSLEVRMACGVGVCYGCTIKTRSGLKQVCKDGPVFDLDDMLWEKSDLHSDNYHTETEQSSFLDTLR